MPDIFHVRTGSVAVLGQLPDSVTHFHVRVGKTADAVGQISSGTFLVSVIHQGAPGTIGHDGADGPPGVDGAPGPSGLLTAQFPLVYDPDAKDISFDDSADPFAKASDLLSETSDRETADSGLQTAIDDEASTRENEFNALTASIADELSARIAADADIQALLDAEVAARITADTSISTAITNEIADRVAALLSKADLVGGVIPTSQIPAIALVNTFPVASQAAMLALTAQPGDLAIRTDTGDRFILGTGGTASVLSDWITLSTPATIVSVNGQIGIVVLGYADVGADQAGAAAAALSSANAYTDVAVSSEATTRASAVSAAITTANNYTDMSVASEATARITAVSAAIVTSENYTDTAVAGEVTARTTAITNAISTSAADATTKANAAQSASLQKTSNLSDLGSATTARGNLGLGNVDNTSDENKPVSTAQASADATVQAYAIDRNHHTGTQTLSTIDDAGTAAAANTGTTSGTVPVLGTGGVLDIARLATGTPDGTKFVRDDGTLATPSTQQRTTATQGTSSLAAGATDNTTNITVAKSFVPLTMQCSKPAWVTLYATAAARTADAGRTQGTDPVAGSGVILELIATTTGTYTLDPFRVASNLDSTPSSTIYMKVVNNDSTTGVVTVTLKYEPVEV